jgi:hypothetical protein
MSRTDLILSILVLSRSESGAINSSEIAPVESITKAAKIFSSISTKCCTLSNDIEILYPQI